MKLVVYNKCVTNIKQGTMNNMGARSELLAVLGAFGVFGGGGEQRSGRAIYLMCHYFRLSFPN